MTNREEIERRRTFAIISHPDAGKTTLTEKLLLYGGAINQAGSVKGKQSAKHAVSDWMDIEKQRGISVTSSVLQFNYQGKCINILDTPGHQDFSEDTYRTLMAADSAVMVIDAAKGVEAQTIKLFKVCTLRHIPIFTFINKMDREARDPFELMENIEEILGIKTYPMNWPIGCGKEFKGVFDRNTRKVLAFSSDGRANGVKKVNETEAELGDAALDELLTPYLHQQLVDEIELLDGAAEEFDLDKVLRGELSPVFFGSALTNFGVTCVRQRNEIEYGSDALRRFGDSAPLRYEDGANGQRLGAETEAHENQTHATQLPRKTNRLYFETRDGDGPSRHHAFPYCSLLPSRLPRAFCVRRSHRWHAICQRSIRNRDRYDEYHAQPFRPLRQGRQLPERHRHASRARKQERPRVC